MQTFLPYPDFIRSAQTLDWKRLGKQRVEGMQLLKAILGERKLDGNFYNGWTNHPATKMWSSYPDALKVYTNSMINEWILRGYKNNIQLYEVPRNYTIPDWLGNEFFHASHRSNLLRKDFNYYSQYGWQEQNDLPYIWPADSL